MRLQEFITANSELILSEWVAFARTRAGADGMNVAALRDHAAGMLAHIATDLGTPQTATEQFEKSQGPAEDSVSAPPEVASSDADSPAEIHGSDRATNGFSVGEMLAEFRALRASVLRLWIGQCGTLNAADLQDVMRFNEAIDQAVAESVSRFTREIDGARDMVIAILSHDLRTPLQTVLITTQQFLETPSIDPQRLESLMRAQRSAVRMKGMIDDLLDFTRSRLGGALSIVVREVDLAPLVREMVGEVGAAHPGHTFRLDVGAGLLACCDASRMKQVLGNLLSNAVEHGLAGSPIVVSASTEGKEIVMAVQNDGTAIAQKDIAGIFGPFKRLRGDGANMASASPHLGLGLYIADQLVAAHGGTLGVTSTAGDGTRFEMRIPRDGPCVPGSG